MGFVQNIEKWFDAHKGTRAFVKDAIKAFLGLLVFYKATAIEALPPEYLAIGMAIFGIIAWLNQLANQHTTWPIVGAKK